MTDAVPDADREQLGAELASQFTEWASREGLLARIAEEQCADLAKAYIAGAVSAAVAAAPHLAAADPTTENEGFRAYKAGLAAGRSEGIAAERARILVPDETVHADGSIGPDSAPAEYSQDPAYWYRRWLFAMKQLDEEAYQRICGWPEAAAAERERIRQLMITELDRSVLGPVLDRIWLRTFANRLTDAP